MSRTSSSRAGRSSPIFRLLRRGKRSYRRIRQDVMPGGVDSHAIWRAQSERRRLMRPEDHYKSVRAKTVLTIRQRLHHPFCLQAGYDYAAMATRLSSRPPCRMEARHTHEEMRATPILTWAYMSWATTGSSCVTSTTATSRRPRLHRLDDEDHKATNKMR